MDAMPSSATLARAEPQEDARAPRGERSATPRLRNELLEGAVLGLFAALRVANSLHLIHNKR